jgi:hypothetical protein
MHPPGVWPPGCFPPVDWDEEEHRSRLRGFRDRLRPLGIGELIKRAVETGDVHEATAAMDLLREAPGAFRLAVESFEDAYEAAGPTERGRIECCLAYLLLPAEERPPG